MSLDTRPATAMATATYVGCLLHVATFRHNKSGITERKQINDWVSGQPAWHAYLGPECCRCTHWHVPLPRWPRSCMLAILLAKATAAVHD